MAIATIERSGQAASAGVVVKSPRPPLRWPITALLAAAVAPAVLVGLADQGTVRAGDGPSTLDGSDAWTARLEAEAEAYFAEQANRERGWAADSARLQAAADASR